MRGIERLRAVLHRRSRAGRGQVAHPPGPQRGYEGVCLGGDRMRGGARRAHRGKLFILCPDGDPRGERDRFGRRVGGRCRQLGPAGVGGPRLSHRARRDRHRRVADPREPPRLRGFGRDRLPAGGLLLRGGGQLSRAARLLLREFLRAGHVRRAVRGVHVPLGGVRLQEGVRRLQVCEQRIRGAVRQRGHRHAQRPGGAYVHHEGHPRIRARAPDTPSTCDHHHTRRRRSLPPRRLPRHHHPRCTEPRVGRPVRQIHHPDACRRGGARGWVRPLGRGLIVPRCVRFRGGEERGYPRSRAADVGD
mmetsp:Transcript_21562/g.51153  ORF Transcript_21562/g.51153 Transcript_21562/m.51153 type:complete len:304 (+) Transcript_21562:604-1515(+)